MVPAMPRIARVPLPPLALALLLVALPALARAAADKTSYPNAERYAGWDTELGRGLLAGKHSLALLYERQLGQGEPTPTSGRQEHLENLVARHIERAR